MSFDKNQLDLNEHLLADEKQEAGKSKFFFALGLGFIIAGAILVILYIKTIEQTEVVAKPLAEEESLSKTPTPLVVQEKESKPPKSEEVHELRQELVRLKDKIKKLESATVTTVEKKATLVPAVKDKDAIAKLEVDEATLERIKIQKIIDLEAQAEKREFVTLQKSLRLEKVELLKYLLEKSRVQKELLAVSLTKDAAETKALKDSQTDFSNQWQSEKKSLISAYRPIELGDDIELYSRGVRFTGEFGGIERGYIKIGLIDVWAADHKDIVRRASKDMLKRHLEKRESDFLEDCEVLVLEALRKTEDYRALVKNYSALQLAMKKVNKKINAKELSIEKAQQRLNKLNIFYRD